MYDDVAFKQIETIFANAFKAGGMRTWCYVSVDFYVKFYDFLCYMHTQIEVYTMPQSIRSYDAIYLQCAKIAQQRAFN